MKNLGTLLFCHGLSFMGTGRPLRPRSAENPFGTAPGASAEGSSLLQLEPSKAAKKQCKGVTKNGAACTAWAMEGPLADSARLGTASDFGHSSPYPVLVWLIANQRGSGAAAQRLPRSRQSALRATDSSGLGVRRLIRFANRV